MALASDWSYRQLNEEMLEGTSSLSDTQERVLASLSLISGTFSMIGSTIIAYLVLMTTPKKTPYKRIMLGLSISDFVASISMLLSSWLIPEATSPRVTARGTDATCSFLGFLTQVSFCALWYNAMLSYYYLLTIRFGVRPRVFAERYEPWLHVICIGYGSVTATWGYIKGYYSEVDWGVGCWIDEYPKGCKENGGCQGEMLAWIFGGVPLVFLFFSILVNNAVIYFYVRKTTKQSIGKSLAGREIQESRVQAVAVQAMLYVGSFLMAYIWSAVVRVTEMFDVPPSEEHRLFPLLVLESFFLPSQGAFNLFIYSRPNYLRVRQANPNETRMFALREAWFGSSTQKPSVNASCPPASRDQEDPRKRRQYTLNIASGEIVPSSSYLNDLQQSNKSVDPPFETKQHSHSTAPTPCLSSMESNDVDAPVFDHSLDKPDVPCANDDQGAS